MSCEEGRFICPGQRLSLYLALEERSLFFIFESQFRKRVSFFYRQGKYQRKRWNGNYPRIFLRCRYFVLCIQVLYAYICSSEIKIWQLSFCMNMKLLFGFQTKLISCSKSMIFYSIFSLVLFLMSILFESWLFVNLLFRISLHAVSFSFFFFLFFCCLVEMRIDALLSIFID